MLSSSYWLFGLLCSQLDACQITAIMLCSSGGQVAILPRPSDPMLRCPAKHCPGGLLHTGHMNTNQIARIAALVGEPARTAMLLALMDGGALTAQ